MLEISAVACVANSHPIDDDDDDDDGDKEEDR